MSAIVLVLLAEARVARADDVATASSEQARTVNASAAPSPPAPSRDWHVGLNLRTDFAARFYRLDFGVRFGRLDFILVADPFGVDAGDYDFDGIVAVALNRHWSIWGGARVTTVPIGRSRQYSDKVLVGVSAIMPSIGIPRVRLHSGLELAVHLVSHGADLMTNWVCIDSPICRQDHFIFSLFGRIEYVSPF